MVNQHFSAFEAHPVPAERDEGCLRGESTTDHEQLLFRLTPPRIPP
jgi:hypothetical protein